MQSATLSASFKNRVAGLRRLVDFLLASAGLIVLSPALLLAALLVKVSSPGPVFHRAVRVGKDGQLFQLFKFRTMIAEAASLGPGITLANDKRITRFGAWLRRFKIDELPQLLNILRGEMSIVGPRPEDPRYVALYTPEQREILAVVPGLTSPASMQYRAEEKLLAGTDWETTYVSVILPDKLSRELDYLQHRTFWSDLRIISQTVLAVFH